VLFTVPSRYWFPIGRRRCLALGGGPPRFPPDSACRAVLTQKTHPCPDRVAYGALTRCGRPFQRRSAASRPPARGPSPPPVSPSNPQAAAPTGSCAARVWAPPRSLAATGGILSLPPGTEMFQFPGCPPHSRAVTGYNTGRVAPFGHPRIAGCQRLPGAFRRVAASFLGRRRLGIHRAPNSAASPAPHPPAPRSRRDPHATGRPARTRAGTEGPGGTASVVSRLPQPFVRSVPCSWFRGSVVPWFVWCGVVCVASRVPGTPPGTAAGPWSAPRALGCQGTHDRRRRRRTERTDGPGPGWSRGDSNPGPPPCKGGALPAKLRPPKRVASCQLAVVSSFVLATGNGQLLTRPGGRAWTRTRDLGLIRAAL
jgi:hypothetical protein